MHTLFLARQGGFLLHAASAVRNGRALLFFGRSGAGKTTMMRMAPAEATLLTDEISYIRREGSNYFAHGTPFTGELAKPGENITARISGLYYLVQASRNKLTTMKPAEAAGVLLESVLFFAEDQELVKLVFQSACDMVSRLPVYKLEFKRDPSVWGILE
jgi:energy-coupling factor transporter ATP-binding protein EcfA2